MVATGMAPASQQLTERSRAGGEQALRHVAEQLAPPQRGDPTLDKYGQHELDIPELNAEDQDSSHISLDGSACPSEKHQPEKGRLLKQKLFEALRGAPEGPIELDPAMLYSPASSLQPPSSRSGDARPGAFSRWVSSRGCVSGAPQHYSAQVRCSQMPEAITFV